MPGSRHGRIFRPCHTTVNERGRKGKGEGRREALARRARGDGAIALTTLDSLRAAVLRSAVARTGGAKEAYLLFGGEAVVKSRNHGKELKRELESLEALERELKR